MRYYIVFLDFDTDVVNIDSFDNLEAFENAKNVAKNNAVNQNYDKGQRDWFSYSTWQECT